MSGDALEVHGGWEVDVDDLYELAAACRGAARSLAEAGTRVGAAAAQARLVALALTIGRAGAASAAGAAVACAEAAAAQLLLGAAGLADAGWGVTVAAERYGDTENAIVGSFRLIEVSGGYLAKLRGEVVGPGPGRGADPDSLIEPLAAALATAYVRRDAVIGPPTDLGGRRAPAGVADLVALVEPGRGPGCAPPPPGRVDVTALTRRRPDGATETTYVVALPGTHGALLPEDVARRPEVRHWGSNAELIAGRGSAEVAALPAALAAAGVPKGATVALVGHSQGGMAAYAAAGDEAMRRDYRVTHVITAGSPIGAMAAPRGVRVLALEHRPDPVPALDGRGNTDSALRSTVRFDSSASAGAHDLAHYVDAARRIDGSTDGRLREFAESLRAEGALAAPAEGEVSARLTRVVLSLPVPGGAPPEGGEPAAR